MGTTNSGQIKRPGFAKKPARCTASDIKGQILYLPTPKRSWLVLKLNRLARWWLYGRA